MEDGLIIELMDADGNVTSRHVCKKSVARPRKWPPPPRSRKCKITTELIIAVDDAVQATAPPPELLNRMDRYTCRLNLALYFDVPSVAVWYAAMLEGTASTFGAEAPWTPIREKLEAIFLEGEIDGQHPR